MHDIPVWDEVDRAMTSGIEAGPMEWRRIILAALVIVAAGLLAFHNSFDGVLVFDDGPAIRDNPTLQSLWPLTSPLSPPGDTGLGGRPLANLAFALNRAITGDGVRGYHAGNLLLHISSALLLFGLVRRTLAASLTSRDAGVGRAAAAAVLWAVHPLTTASVSYLSQRTELLMGFCYLVTLYAFTRGWRRTSVAACALGMMSKEVMMTAPVMVLLYDATFVAGSLRAAWQQRRAYYVALAATWLVVGYLLTTGLDRRSVGFGLGVGAFEYAFTQANAVVLYAKLAVWPGPLVFDYGPVYAGSFVALILVAVWLTLAVRGLRRGSGGAFLAVAFLLLLAPTSSIVPVAEQPIAENRMYLPLAALIVLAILGVHRIVSRRFWIVVPIVAVAFATLTVDRNRVYRSQASVWADTVVRRPANPRAHFNLGLALLELGKPADAARHFAEAIRLRPTYPEAHNSLGNALVALGRPAEAGAHYGEAIRLRPRYARAWYNQGLALLLRHELGRAAECFTEALRLEPDFAEAHSSLGNVYFQRGDALGAIPHYERARKLDPALVDAHYNCGSACLEVGRVDDAIACLAEAARLRPDDAEIRNHHGAALFRAGRVREAVAQFEEALRLNPQNEDARSNLQLARASR